MKTIVKSRVSKVLFAISLCMAVISFLPLTLAGGLKIPAGIFAGLQVFWYLTNFDVDGVPRGLPAVIPFAQNDRGRIDVLTTLRQKEKVVFFFDTGSPETCLSNGSLMHPLRIWGTSLVKRTYARTSEIYEQECGLTPKLTFGDLSFSYPWVSYFDSSKMVSNPEFAGFIGSNYFSNCEVTIDIERSKIIVRRSDFKRTRNWSRFEGRPYLFPFSGTQIIIDGHLENRPAKFILDTGATGIIIPPRVADSLFRDSSPIAISSKGATTLYPNNQCSSYKISNLLIGSNSFHNLNSTIILSNEQAQIDSGRQSIILGGKEFMNRLRSVCIDYPNRRIKFVPN